MVVIHTRKGKVYQFNNSHTASIWIKNFPELYDGDLHNIAIYSDKSFKNTLEVMAVQKAVDEMIQCQGCHSNLKFTVEPEDTAFTIRCPACNTTHIYHNA